MNKELSIIIIALNEEKYISNLLISLSIQTFQNFEVIVVNNNSKDKTKKVAKSFSNKFSEFKVVDLKDILGPGHARNYGAKFAKYKDLLFFDADTIVDKDFIENLYRIKNKKKFEIAAFLLKIDQSFWINIFYLVTNAAIRIVNFFGTHPAMGGIGIFCSKKIFKKIKGFDEKIAFGEDANFTQRASKIGKYKLVNLKNSSSPRRYKDISSVLKIISYNLYRIILRKEIYDKDMYLFGKF